MRTLDVHVGLHKTGTSSVQAFFDAHRDHWRGHGLLYPLAGIVPAYPGHHNLAWELAGDRRFDQRRGTWSTLFSELKTFEGDALLSSEDFESSLAYPSRWQVLKDRAEQSGYELRLLVFLRDQASYIESLYLQNLVLGFGECFNNDLEDVLRFGELRKSDWRFHFDYLKVITSLKKVFGPDALVLRDYEADGSVDAIDAVCEAIQVSPAIGAGLARSHKNPRRSVLDCLINFHNNRFPTQRVTQSLESLQALTQGIGQLTIAPSLRQQIRERFAPGNKALSEEFHLPSLTNLATHAQHASDGLADMSRVFSFETSLLLRKWFSAGRAAREEHQQWMAWVHRQEDAPPR